MLVFLLIKSEIDHDRIEGVFMQYKDAFNSYKDCAADYRDDMRIEEHEVIE